MAKRTERLPRELGFRMPAEWEAHEGTWIGWPRTPATGRGSLRRFRGSMRRSCACSRSMSGCIFSSKRGAEQACGGDFERAGANLERVVFIVADGSRLAARFRADLREGCCGADGYYDWKFNAWAKYDDWRLDDQVPEHVVAEAAGFAAMAAYGRWLTVDSIVWCWRAAASMSMGLAR
jgi:agmatine deiminase